MLTRPLAALALGAALVASPARAQLAPAALVADSAPTFVVAGDTSVVAPAAPSRTALVAGVRRAETVPARVAAHAAERPTHSQARAFAIVGAAAFVTGVILGDDIGTIFMVGGAGVGLFGLYYWLQ